MTGFRVRPAAVTDVPELLPLVQAYWRFEAIDGFEPRRVGASLERLLSEPTLGAAWLAVVDGAVAGYLVAVYVFSLEHTGLTAEIDEFFVAPAHRGRGIGAGLLTAAEDGFVRRGCTNASLQLAQGNAAGRGFYQARGYVARSGYDLMEKGLPATADRD